MEQNQANGSGAIRVAAGARQIATGIALAYQASQYAQTFVYSPPRASRL